MDFLSSGSLVPPSPSVAALFMKVIGIGLWLHTLPDSKCLCRVLWQAEVLI